MGTNVFHISLAVWQEVFDNEDKIRPDTIVQVWKDWGTLWRDEVRKVKPYRIILEYWLATSQN